MVYGDGDGVNSTMLGLDADVTTHELTHAVTEHESDLIYSGESGGLNEAMSDIFGASARATRRAAWATRRGYLHGRRGHLDAGTPGDALRYMDDPAKDGVSLDYYRELPASVDVHYSSGIANLAFSLLSKGGTHPRGKTHQRRARASASEKAGRIFYKANTDLFTASTTFAAGEDLHRAGRRRALRRGLGRGRRGDGRLAMAWACRRRPPRPSPLTNGVAETGLSGASGSEQVLLRWRCPPARPPSSRPPAARVTRTCT